ncbi:MAG: Fe-S protein assembly co-chaperone HscB [Burkholderiales bacterium]
MIDFSRNHFELFGLPARFRLDGPVLDAAFRRLQSDVHPDRHAGAGDEARRIAAQSSARVNEAYRALKDPVRRAQYLLHLHGIDAGAEGGAQLPLEFLEQQLERREIADAAVRAGDDRALAALAAEVRADARAREERLERQLDGERAYADARERVRELMFLVKLAADLDAMLVTLEDQ